MAGKTLLVLVPALATVALAHHPIDDQRATDLLAQAREALGGENALAHVHGLSASGTYQREIADRTMSGELTLDLELPDKMLRTDSMNPMGDATVVMLQGLNGDRVLRNVRTPMGGPNVVTRMAPPGGGAGARDGESAERQALRNQRAEFARMTIALLLTTPPSMPVEYTSGGQAESADGRADVIDAKGAANFGVRIFLDQQNHRPLMLSYRGVAPRIAVQIQRKERGREPARPDGPEQLAPGPNEAPQIVDISLFLDDYRPIDGVLMPHHLSRSIDGKPSEEMTFKTIKLNPAFKADSFSGK